MADSQVFRVSAENFKKIPGSPIAYWVGDDFYNSFNHRALEETVLKVCKGCYTGNNDKYLRLWHEVSFCYIGNGKWHKYSKGGAFRKWYGNSVFVIYWMNDGRELKQLPSAGMGASKYYGKPHYVWSGISTGEPSFRHDPDDVFFDDVSPSVVFENEVEFPMLGMLNSRPIVEFLKVIAPTMHFQAGDIKMLPVVVVLNSVEANVQTLINLSRSDWDEYETSWDFKVNPLVREGWQRSGAAMNIETAWAAVFARRMGWAERMKILEEENNRLFIEAYGLQDELKPDVAWKDVSITGNPAYRYTLDGDPQSGEELARADAMRELISYGMGVLMGRYSLEQEGLILASQGELYKDYIARVHGAGKILPDEDGAVSFCLQETFFFV